MYGPSSKNAANAYAKVSVDTGVLGADPHKLIVLLFNGAIKAINDATHQMNSGLIPEKGKSISHAIAIVEGGLRTSLNKEAGGELGQNLDTLYGYITNQLFLANARNDPKKLEECRKLLGELRDAWEQIAPAKIEPATQSELETQAPAPRDALAPRKASFISV